MAVNQTKTIVHFEGLTEYELASFKKIHLYTFSDLSTGFNYLGYHLKTGTHKAGDWDWLVAKITKKISLWFYRWLSIGGKYILIKLVLEGQPIYWMSMEVIPRPAINKIKKLMFHFLWSGQNESKQYHICRWETLSRPKKNGGWALHNLAHFNLDLTTNTLWRVITQGGIWHIV